jgi:acetoacetyl-CoA synthetase
MVGRAGDTDAVAIVARSQSRGPVEMTFGELRDQVARARAGLQRLGVGPGARVAAYLPNIPETLVAFLATVSLGAVWATCPPEFGPRSVLDRLGQLEPAVLLAVAGYRWGEQLIDRRDQVAAVRAGLPSLRAVVHVPYAGAGRDALPDTTAWGELIAEPGPLEFDPVPFAHPLYVLFSSGTTGLPKAIVHGHGGILLEHLKNHAFSWDLGHGDRLLWFTTTAWMMWNALVSALLTRASIVMIDGNPVWPDLAFQWRLAEQTGATLLGLSPAFTMACRKEGLTPGRDFDLSSLRVLCAAGSPLPPAGYQWLYEQAGRDVFLNVGSGGPGRPSGGDRRSAAVRRRARRQSARRRAQGPFVRRAPQWLVAAPPARRHRPRSRDSAHDDRQETRASRQAHPHRHPRRGRGQPRRPRQPGFD